MLVVESELLELAVGQQGSGTGQVSDEHLDAVLESRPDLCAEQADMVRAVAGSGDGIQVVRSAAGTGKTYALDVARAAWEANGHRVIGAALSARAAAELRDQSGIQSTTIARLLSGLQHGYGFDECTVLVVDEAGMVGTRAVAEIAHHAAAARAKIVLVGDDRQLPEIQAGGALRGLADRLGAAELKEVRRQREEWDRSALNALRGGDIDGWSVRYREHGRVVSAPDAEASRAALVADWWRSHRDSPESQSVMIALRRADVADLNDRARDAMRAAGRLGHNELVAGGSPLSEGDRVVTQRNHQGLGLTSGTLATVEKVDLEERMVTLRTDDGRSVKPPSEYVADGHLGPAYALTAHKAQGMTVDRAFVLGSEELYREWGYTALSRHRDQARFYLTAPADQSTLPGLETPQDLVTEELNRTLGRSRAKEMATDIATRSGASDTVAAPERRAEAEATRRRLREPQPPPASRAEEITTERDAAEARLAQTQQARSELPWWKRRQREELDRQIEQQSRAADHWRERSDRVLAALAEEERKPSARPEATGPERLRLQAAERSALVETLSAPPPPMELPIEDIGLEL